MTLVPFAHAADKAAAGAMLHVAGEKLDSGLGELAPYSQWVDNSGRLRLDIARR